MAFDDLPLLRWNAGNPTRPQSRISDQVGLIGGLRHVEGLEGRLLLLAQLRLPHLLLNLVIRFKIVIVTNRNSLTRLVSSAKSGCYRAYLYPRRGRVGYLARRASRCSRALLSVSIPVPYCALGFPITYTIRRNFARGDLPLPVTREGSPLAVKTILASTRLLVVWCYQPRPR